MVPTAISTERLTGFFGFPPQDPLFVRHVLGGVEWALLSKTTRAFNPDGKVGNGPCSGSAAITS